MGARKGPTRRKTVSASEQDDLKGKTGGGRVYGLLKEAK